jgi:hypothetical protein
MMDLKEEGCGWTGLNEMVGHVARMGRGEACTGFRWGNLRERDQWGNPGTNERIILRWIFWKWDVGYGLDSVRWLAM